MEKFKEFNKINEQQTPQKKIQELKDELKYLDDILKIYDTKISSPSGALALSFYDVIKEHKDFINWQINNLKKLAR